MALFNQRNPEHVSKSMDLHENRCCCTNKCAAAATAVIIAGDANSSSSLDGVRPHHTRSSDLCSKGANADDALEIPHAIFVRERNTVGGGVAG